MISKTWSEKKYKSCHVLFDLFPGDTGCHSPGTPKQTSGKDHIDYKGIQKMPFKNVLKLLSLEWCLTQALH